MYHDLVELSENTMSYHYFVRLIKFVFLLLPVLPGE